MKKFGLELLKMGMVVAMTFGFVIFAITRVTCVSTPRTSIEELGMPAVATVEVELEGDSDSEHAVCEDLSSTVEFEQRVEQETNPETSKRVSIGMFLASAYCCENYPHICNDGDATHTATGTVPTPGRTVAVDPSVVPYGVNLFINGHTYVAEDCGEAIKGNRIDICFYSHSEALDFGVQEVEVFVVNNNK